MTGLSAEHAWFAELLGSLGPIPVRRMFGGAGFYVDGMMIALEAEGTLYLKADAESRPRFEAAGGHPFVYAGKGEPVTMQYWTPPDEAMDSPDAMRPWAQLAREAALRAAAAKAKKAGTPKADARVAGRPPAASSRRGPGARGGRRGSATSAE